MLIILFLILLIVGLIIAGTCYGHLVSTYKKYSVEQTGLNVTAFNFLKNQIKLLGLKTTLALTDGELTDAYLFKKDIIVLSEGVANDKSIASLSVATHELGHALQKKDKSIYLRLHTFFTIVGKIANFLLPIALVTCLILLFFEQVSSYALIIFYVSIGLWFLSLLFKIFLIPLELDASKRAYNILSQNEFLTKPELRQAKKVLNAAALTYVGSLFAGLYKLIYNIKKLFRRD